MRLNPLPPTLKENNRYIVFEIVSEVDLSLDGIVKAIWNSALELFGEAGTARFNLWVPSTLFDSSKKMGIVRTSNTSVEEVRAALATIREIDGQKATFFVRGVTGTVKSAKMKFMGVPLYDKDERLK